MVDSVAYNQSYNIFFKQVSMKAAIFIFYILLAFPAFSFKMTPNNIQLEDFRDLAISVMDQANRNQQEYSNFDDYYLQLTEVDTIYYNGTIITMNDQQEIAEAVSLRNGVIVEVGSNAHVFRKCRWNVNNIKMVNLNRKTMLPGFYDAHSHLVIHSLAKSTRLSLASPPIGSITSIDQIKNIIRSHIQSKNIAVGEVVYCSFYNQLALEEKRHVTRLELDEVSMKHVIVLEHISGHLGVANSKAIEMAGVTENTPDPSGGKIQRFIDGPYKGSPSGVFKERAKVQYLDRFSKTLKANEESEAIIHEGIKDYIQSGITTAQQGFIGQGAIQLFLAMKDRLKIDLRGYTPCFDTFSNVYDQYFKQQTNRFKLQGIKLIIDGSIQGYTGFLSQPYYKSPEGQHSSNIKTEQNNNRNLQSDSSEELLFRGSPIFTQDQIDQIVLKALQRQIDVLAHCNGDAAIDIYLEAIQQAKLIYPCSKSRITIIHAQTIRNDQLDQVKKLGVIPSFFVGHTYYWGDEHRDKFLGPQRAKRISPAGSALLRKIDFTLHNDAPVTPMQNGIFMTIWSAVNRLTLSGSVLGEEQRIDVMQALKSVTIKSAYQSHEQHVKGSIERGKLGDLIILSENPLKVEVMKLREIEVVETIKNGVSIFKR